MRDEHILILLEANAVTRLRDEEVSRIEVHITGCLNCRKAYQASRVSHALVESRATESVEVSPFFKTRVMAAIREQQLSTELPALLRMWKAAGALVSSLAVLVVLLFGLTFFNYATDPSSQSPELTSMQSLYSPEYVMLEADDSADAAVPYDEVFEAVYDSEDANGN